MKIFESLSPEWQQVLAEQRPLIERIGEQLARYADAGQQFVPAIDNIFRCLQKSPSHIRVIIVGQDPYPNPKHACGLSFSVPLDTTPLPASLRNIVSELKSDVGTSLVEGGDLSPWVSQGVLLMNYVLTTEVGKPGSHRGLGWQEVTSAIVRAVRTANPDVVAILWGKDAQALSGEFAPSNVVAGVHPSPLSAYRGFFGSKPFSQVNARLQASGQLPIRW